MNVLALLHVLLTMQTSLQYVPFYEEAYWQKEMEAISDSDEIIAIANSVLHGSKKGIPLRRTRIVLMYSKNGEWFYKKYLYKNWDHKFQKLSEAELSLVSASYINDNLKDFASVLDELKDVVRDPLGNGYIEYYYKNDNLKYTKSYFKCPGKGDINGFVNGKYQLLFKFYSIGNNSDPF